MGKEHAPKYIYWHRRLKMATNFALDIKSSLWEGTFVDHNGLICDLKTLF